MDDHELFERERDGLLSEVVQVRWRATSVCDGRLIYYVVDDGTGY
jgi:hypothetical protein